MFHRIIIAILFVLTPYLSQAEIYKYTDLMGQNLDSMNAKINSLYKEADISKDLSEMKADKRALTQQKQLTALREALRFILSRPDKDNLSLKLLPRVRDPLMDKQMYESTLASLSEEAMRALGNKSLKPIYRATQLFLLENIMAETRPLITENPVVKKMFISIRDKKIKVDKDVKKIRRNRGLYKSRSPSKVAAAILKKSSTKKE